jgi:hypothetical protein
MTRKAEYNTYTNKMEVRNTKVGKILQPFK